jgi:hypothetical protein
MRRFSHIFSNFPRNSIEQDQGVTPPEALLVIIIPLIVWTKGLSRQR